MSVILSNYQSISFLQDAINSGIVNLDSVHDMLMKSKLERVKEIHTYAITPPNGSCSRWQTSFKDSTTGKRKNIKAHTQEELWEKLVPLYFSMPNIDKITFHNLYDEWLVYKTTVTNSPNTIKRHKQHYKKYFEPSILDIMTLKKIDELTLETECNRIVKEHNLSRKEWVNIKTILNGMYKYAVRKKYMSENLIDKITISVAYRQIVKRTGKTETYNTDELKQINQYLDSMYSETEDVVFLAVKLNFLIGLRVGELVALKWSDHETLSQLHIIREEIRNQETNAIEVVEHTKTHQDRYVALVPKAIGILNKIPKQGEYIFIRDGERITSRQINYVLEKYAERKGVKTKSSHKIRKTYASRLNANGVPLDCIREQLGHNNLSTTLGYIYNPLTEKETYDLITKAL